MRAESRTPNGATDEKAFCSGICGRPKLWFTIPAVLRRCLAPTTNHADSSFISSKRGRHIVRPSPINSKFICYFLHPRPLCLLFFRNLLKRKPTITGAVTVHMHAGHTPAFFIAHTPQNCQLISRCRRTLFVRSIKVV